MAELSEEARLSATSLVRLLPEGSAGICEVKWCRNRFTPFLAIDPLPDSNPGEREEEEEHLQVCLHPLEMKVALKPSAIGAQPPRVCGGAPS